MAVDSSRLRLIAGFGRSGTTWVQDVLATANSLRSVFEPLHPDVFVEATRHAHAYRNSDNEDPALYNFLCRFFIEDFHSMWVDYRIRLDLLYPRPRDLSSWIRLKRVFLRIAKSKQNYSRYHSQRRFDARIVKCVRANMMLPWLQKNFDAQIVFLIRHPAAVVMSQMTSPDVWKPFSRINRYRADSRLLDILNDQTRELLNGRLDDVEAFTLSWCIENSVALKQARDCGILVTYYEDLLNRGQPEWRRILAALDLQVMPDNELLNLPSQQARGEQVRDLMQNYRYATWMNNIESNTARRIQNILDITGMDVYRVDQALPIRRP